MACAGGTGDSYAALSLLFQHLVQRLQEATLMMYKKWIAVALFGIGHHGGAVVRKNFTRALRTLVPLAPLLTNLAPTPSLAPAGAARNGELERENASVAGDVAVSDMVDNVLTSTPHAVSNGVPNTATKSPGETIRQQLEHLRLKAREGDAPQVCTADLTCLSLCRGRPVAWCSRHGHVCLSATLPSGRHQLDFKALVLWTRCCSGG